jgi:hypothetical protein
MTFHDICQQLLDSHEPFKGYYVRLTCNGELIHDSKVNALAISINKQTHEDRLLYICPICKMQHESLLEG